MIYLIEFEAMNGAGNLVTERLATDGYTTQPSDDPANAYFDERVKNPGNFERAMFGSGRTSGEAEVGYGVIELTIGDDGAGDTLDRLADYAVDGRRLRIWALETAASPWADRVMIFVGTMEQVEIGWTMATIRIKDRLAELRKPLQVLKYAGTTTAGGMNEAEGAADDLKDSPKPMLWGAARNIPAVLANRYDRIYQISSRPLSGIQGVFDRGVGLTASADHATIAALRAATITGGQYHTSLALGLIRVASEPDGDLTVDATEGANGQRSVAAIVRRILDHFDLVEGADYDGETLDALHAEAPAEAGIWLGTDEQDTLDVVTELMESIGGYMVPDRLGVLRFGRLTAPSAGGPVLDKTIILDANSGLQRIAMNDEGNGVPAHKVTVEYSKSWLVQDASVLDNTAATSAQKAFVSKEYRKTTAENPAVKTRHLLASELTFQTLLANEADATAEAQRRLALYSIRRDRYQVPMKTEIATDLGLDLGHAVTLQFNRYGLSAGKPMVIIGIETDLRAGITALDLFG